MIENALKRSFTPEFLNRIDDVVIFESLSKENINKIIDIELKAIFERVKEIGYNVQLTEKARDFIMEKGWDVQYGARPLKRAIQRHVEDVLSEALLQFTISKGTLITIDLDEEKKETKVIID